MSESRIDSCIIHRRAKELPPSPIPNVTTPVLAHITNFSSRVGKLFDGVFAASTSTKAQRRLSSEAPSMYQPSLHRAAAEGGIELADNSKDGQVLEGTRAERRYAHFPV
jgi:hypothetical protein